MYPIIRLRLSLVANGPDFRKSQHACMLYVKFFYAIFIPIRPGAKYIEKYSNTLQLLSLINDYNYITITGPVEM